jgi:hypothetical protein
MEVEDIAALPLAQRLAAMEALWDSLIRDAGHDPSPGWHADVLAQRRAELEVGEALPWDDVKAGLRRLESGSR